MNSDIEWSKKSIKDKISRYNCKPDRNIIENKPEPLTAIYEDINREKEVNSKIKKGQSHISHISKNVQEYENKILNKKLKQFEEIPNDEFYKEDNNCLNNNIDSQVSIKQSNNENIKEEIQNSNNESISS